MKIEMKNFMQNGRIITRGLIYAVLCSVSVVSFAQPADSEIKLRATNAGAIETRFTSEKGTVHTTLTEKWYIRTIESKWGTDYPEIKRWERTEYRYDYVGGKWVFTKSYLNSSWFDGIPNPTEEEVIALLTDSKVGYQNAVIEPPKFKLAADPTWNWHTYNSVEFMVEVVFFEKTSLTAIAQKKINFPVRLYRDTGNGQHDPNTKVYYKNTPWLPVHMPVLSSTYGTEEILTTTHYSEEEMAAFQTINVIALGKAAELRFKSLGSLEIPVFKTDKEAIVWIHERMLEGDKAKIELMLLQMGATYFFEMGNSYLLNERGQQFLQNIVSAANHYSFLYCQHPTLKHEQENMIQFYDRELESHARIALTLENGLFKIDDIDCYFTPSADKVARSKAAGDANCGEPIDTSLPVEITRFELNDAVIVNWNGQNKDYYKGKIIKKDPYNENRYFIEFDQIQSAWIDAKYIAHQN